MGWSVRGCGRGFGRVEGKRLRGFCWDVGAGDGDWKVGLYSCIRVEGQRTTWGTNKWTYRCDYRAILQARGRG